MAGKTGTTENYGDAWFVGYTPQLAVAVWVGYPTTLKPMLTEFHGEPVAGGTFPALIWKSFVESALKRKPAVGFPYPGSPYTSAKLVVRRGDRLMLDNGICKGPKEVVYFAGRGPSKAANCLVNEVQVPDVRRLAIAEAQARVEAQPLTAELVYKPAEAVAAAGCRRGPAPEARLPLLVRPDPPRRLEGDPGSDPEPRRQDLADARQRLKRLKLEPKVSYGTGKPGTVLQQKPRAGLAAAPGVEVQLVVARTARTAAAG